MLLLLLRPWLFFLTLRSQALGLSTRPTSVPKRQRVCIIGGTHGNEYTGIYCIKSIQPQLVQLNQDFSSLDISTVFANPPAHLANRRFLDRDLNRAFSIDDLYTDEDNNDWESQRARELDALLGPKSTDTPAMDIAVDLHSTTSNMGTTLIFPEGDFLMAQAAAYIQAKMPAAAETRVLVEPLPPRPYRPNVGSCAIHDFTIEVGPVPQGVIRHDCVEHTQNALHFFLEFLHRHFDQQQRQDDKERDAYQELLQLYEGSFQIPCFCTAPAENGALAGKIPWPSDPDNDNFPAYMVHKDVQDRDFFPIRKGDPLFVRQQDGAIIPYDGSHGPEIYLIFINEAGYYYASSGTGLGVAYKGCLDLRTGKLVVDENEIKKT